MEPSGSHLRRGWPADPHPELTDHYQSAGRPRALIGIALSLLVWAGTAWVLPAAAATTVTSHMRLRASASRLRGFDQLGFVVSAPAHDQDRPTSTGIKQRVVGRGCALLATTTAQQERGLMGQRSLDAYQAMIFVWNQPVSESFYMKDTLIPLSIAWFDQRGTFIDATSMKPCPPGTEACPLYGATRPYTMAMEVPQGRLSSLGIGPSSVLHVGGTCP